MENKILLTGSSGFLGTFIMNEYLNLKIKGLSRSNSHYNFDLANQIPFIKENFDLVIHCAGNTNNSFSKLGLYDYNVNCTLNLLRGLYNSNKIPKKIVFISSVSVYGLIEGDNVNEKYPLVSIDSYGKSKIESEKIIIKWCKENNVLCTILRLPLIVGDNPPGNLGAMINGIKKGYYFNIAGGLARKSMVLAQDVAKIILKASEIGGTYNLTDGNHPNFFELSNAIAKQNRKSNLFNLPFFVAKSIAFFGDIIGDKFPLNSNKLKKITSDLTFCDTKARIVLGWKPNKVLDYYLR